MKVRIGAAPDSWGVWFAEDPKQPPWRRFLDEAAEAGYEGVELGPYGYLPNDLPTVRAELDARGLAATGANAIGDLHDSDAWPGMEEIVRRRGEVVAGLGAGIMVLIGGAHTDGFTGERTSPPSLDDDGWSRTIEITHRLADISRSEFGLQLAYHPHVGGHIEYEHQIETFLERTDPGLVSLCLDTGHHAYRGGDPVAFTRKHGGRIPYLHLKDIEPNVLSAVDERDAPMAEAVEMGVFCEPPAGVVDFPALRDLLREIDYDGWAVVEQDMYGVAFDVPLPIAKRTREYLRDIDLG